MPRPKLYKEPRARLMTTIGAKLKERIEKAAAKAGITAGQWIEQAAQEKLDRKDV